MIVWVVVVSHRLSLFDVLRGTNTWAPTCIHFPNNELWIARTVIFHSPLLLSSSSSLPCRIESTFTTPFLLFSWDSNWSLNAVMIKKSTMLHKKVKTKRFQNFLLTIIWNLCVSTDVELQYLYTFDVVWVRIFRSIEYSRHRASESW